MVLIKTQHPPQNGFIECDTCEGSGYAPNDNFVGYDVCPVCGGQGQMDWVDYVFGEGRDFRYYKVINENIPNHADPGIRGSLAWAINRSSDKGCVIDIGPGVFNCSTPLLMEGANLTLRGIGGVIKNSTQHSLDFEIRNCNVFSIMDLEFDGFNITLAVNASNGFLVSNMIRGL